VTDAETLEQNAIAIAETRVVGRDDMGQRLVASTAVLRDVRMGWENASTMPEAIGEGKPRRTREIALVRACSDAAGRPRGNAIAMAVERGEGSGAAVYICMGFATEDASGEGERGEKGSAVAVEGQARARCEGVNRARKPSKQVRGVVSMDVGRSTGDRGAIGWCGVKRRLLDSLQMAWNACMGARRGRREAVHAVCA